MKFWTYLDRNGEGIALFILLVAAFASCGNDRCHVRAGCVSVERDPSTDAGAE